MTAVERWNFKAAQVDMIGQRFGKLVVTGRVESDGAGRSRWRCRCDCGGERVTLRQTLIRGDAISCGCIRRKGAKRPGVEVPRQTPDRGVRGAASSAARQSFEDAWADACASARRLAERVTIRWEAE